MSTAKEKAYEHAQRLARFLGAEFREVNINPMHGHGVTLRFVPRDGESIAEMVERIIECS